MKIRPAIDADRDAIWNMIHEVVVAGDTYALDPNISREDAMTYWFAPGIRTYVAEIGGEFVRKAASFPATPTRSSTVKGNPVIAGTYILRPNQSGGGSHVANAGFIVSATARGRGIGRAMAEHCLSEARQFGFRAMQFNYVICTNTAAIRLWQDLGFAIVGTLAKAFRHPKKDYVDVHVMYRALA
ncbi:MAG: GNAT family N-acetyltransferase [Candidatus Udaeobacter sp.]